MNYRGFTFPRGVLANRDVAYEPQHIDADLYRVDG